MGGARGVTPCSRRPRSEESPLARAKRYDAVIVGSGAGGATAAWVLASKGLEVLLLEAGRHYDPQRETPMFAAMRDAPLRGEA